MRLSSRRAVASLLVLALLGWGCAPGDAGSDTSPPPDTTSSAPPTSAPRSSSTTTSTPPPETTSTEPDRERDYETAECGEVSGALICEAYELIQRHYVDPVEDEELVDGALEGLAGSDVPQGDELEVCPLPSQGFLAVCDTIADADLDAEEAEEAAVAGMAFLSLDPNSGYFDAEALELIEEEQSGQIEGIGALVATEEEGSDEANTCQVISPECRLRIVSTIEGGPAQQADLQPDDEFLRVNGESLDGMSVEQVTSMVRGPAGSDVQITFLRDGEEFTVTITRAAVQVPVVQSEVVDDAAYIQLNVFTDNADEQLEAELSELLDQGAGRLVLDLRNNPGGLLETAIEVTSEFIDDGLVASTESPDGVTPYPVEPGGIATDPDLPLYVVVNEGSASASEVVAGALADAGRATIVGESTFGKNTVQQRFPLSNGGALKLTIARWLTPDGRDFGGSGITPDVEMELPPSLTASEVVERVTAVET